MNTEIIRINYQELRNNSQTEARCFRLYLDIRIFEFCFTTLKSWTFLSRHWHDFSLDAISCETSYWVLLFQRVSTRKIQTQRVNLEQSGHHHHHFIKSNLFWPWKIAHLALNNNCTLYCYEFAVTRNHVCLLFEILREFSRVLCKQNHLTTGWQLSWIFEVYLFNYVYLLLNC